MKQILYRTSVLFLVLCARTHAAEFSSHFTTTHDRVWIGSEYWANPMEDWLVQDGQLECTSNGSNRNIHVLTYQLGSKNEPFTAAVQIKLLDRGKATGSAGFRLGAKDDIDDYRAAALRGRGLDCGVTSDGQLFIQRHRAKIDRLPDSAQLRLTATPSDSNTYKLVLDLLNLETGQAIGSVSVSDVPADRLVGSVALVNNHPSIVNRKKRNAARFAFQRWTISGGKLEHHAERAFGPILWAMHSLSNSRTADGLVMKMTAQMPPMGEQYSQVVELEVNRNGTWHKIGRATIDPDARTSTFRIPKWNADQDVAYRLIYKTTTKDGQSVQQTYAGTVRRNPIDRTLVVGAFTGNQDTVFPNLEIAKNVEIQNPDLLFFSGDQIYEGVGGFGIIRQPADRAILNYLRKWYLFGWAFGPLMRDRVTICLPDDHDVYQGNLWGGGGRKISKEEWSSRLNGAMVVGGKGGYVQPAEMVNAVHRTQCSHHPDLYDPTPVKQGITVYYGDMVYGRVSFAIIGDREFKSGPVQVATWRGRADHMTDPNYDVKKMDLPGLKLLGDRQIDFLRHWSTDWRDSDMKVVLSETIFCNLANYHGGARQFVLADLDSNGWPQSGRDRALDAMRRGFAFHIAGDQHLASITQNGIDQFGDSGYAFCVPSIANAYPRSWLPDKEGRPVKNRPTGGAPNTGEYQDGFKNKITVFAIANPADKYRRGRTVSAQDKSSGYAIVRLDQVQRTITMECYHLLSDAANPKKSDQFPGWPKTIQMMDNYGRQATAWLPTLKVAGASNPVVQVIREETGEIVYTVRIKGKTFQPKVFESGSYTVRVGQPELNQWKTLKGLKGNSDKKRAGSVDCS